MPTDNTNNQSKSFQNMQVTPAVNMFRPVVALALGFLCALAQAEENEFVHIGSFVNSVRGHPKSGVMSQYFVSVNAADWARARKACQEQVGGDLLTLETEEEFAAVGEHLSSHDFAGSYWTSGMMSSPQYGIWAATNTQLPVWLNWFPGQPPSTTKFLHRVFLEHNNVAWSFFKAEFNTVPLQYICEV